MQRLIGAAVLAIVLSGCSAPLKKHADSGDDSSSPACTKVWQDGATLPKDYQGCTRPDGDLEAAVTIKCDSGEGTFTTYEDNYFALLGGTITKASSDSDAYAAAYAKCNAG